MTDELDTFCRERYPRLVGLLSLYCADADLAEELAQDALARLVRDWSKVSTMDSPEAWIHRVALNLANSTFRRRGAEARAKQRLEAQPSAAHQPPKASDIVVREAHFSVTHSGWPSVMTTGPLELSHGFGEARGAHPHFNDENPTFDVHTRNRYLVMGPVAGCGNVDEGVTTVGQRTYGAKCLSFEGDQLGIFVSIYGPRSFVRSVQEGLELAD